MILSHSLLIMLTVPVGCFCLAVHQAVNVGALVLTNRSRIAL